jgi:O-methyltransferase
MNSIKKIIRHGFNKFGFELTRKSPKHLRPPVELTPAELRIIEDIKSCGLSMVSDERLWSTLMACKYCVSEGVEGDFVECGVWRGGNALIAAAIFRLYGIKKSVYLFDTFGGMTAPTDKDRFASDSSLAYKTFEINKKETHNDWCFASIEDVKENFNKFGLLSENIKFIKGDVCETLDIKKNIPDQICVLRLDTDWYESTRKELEVLYPKVCIGGSLIIDDYGHWSGAKEATDEYFRLHNNRPLLNYIDYSGRIGVKVK